MKRKISNCNECESEYFSETSNMINLCPECSYRLYEYENCKHEFENKRCIKCYWNGNVSEFLKNRK